MTLPPDGLIDPLPLTPRAKFGERLRSSRLTSGLNLKQVAELVEDEYRKLFRQADVQLSWQALQHWERGRRLPRTRPILLAVVSVLVNRLRREDEAPFGADEANELLRLADHRELDETEMETVFGASLRQSYLVKIATLVRGARHTLRAQATIDGAEIRVTKRRRGRHARPLEESNVGHRFCRYVRPEVAQVVQSDKRQIDHPHADHKDHLLRSSRDKQRARMAMHHRSVAAYHDNKPVAHPDSRRAEVVHPKAQGISALVE